MQEKPANTGLLYRNLLIVDILQKALFRGRDTLPKLFPHDLTITEDGQIEMPAPLVAAAATLVSCRHLAKTPPTDESLRPTASSSVTRRPLRMVAGSSRPALTETSTESI